ncbi:MAG: transposase zinc-binding domain-containing protein [Nitrosomonas sp.]|nr:transposase zinc-binding domain-containing protein [Nitrosomonas sp.]
MAILILYVHYGNQIINLAHAANRRVSIESALLYTPRSFTLFSDFSRPIGAHEKLVAFSCKRRGFYPSCGGRRMAQTAGHLINHVIPNVPVLPWVLSLPIPLCYQFAAHPHLLTPVLQVIQRAISTFLIKQAGLKRRDAQTGAITLIQRSLVQRLILTSICIAWCSMASIASKTTCWNSVACVHQRLTSCRGCSTRSSNAS